MSDDWKQDAAFALMLMAVACLVGALRGFKAVEELMGFTKHEQCQGVVAGSSGDCQEVHVTDLQSAITRLRAADDQHPDFWGTIRDRDADPQMVLDVVAVARAYCRKETTMHFVLEQVAMEIMKDDE